MPRGRFLNKEICIDKKVNELSSYESMLAFTWIIPHLDCNGLTYGDPAVVRSMIFPRRNDITVEQMESYIKEWQKRGLIKIYEKGDEKYIWFPNFAKHQIGLNKTREAKSGIPLPNDFPIEAEKNQDDFQNESGKTPEEVRNNVKLIECNDNSNGNGNGNGEDNASDTPNFYSKFSQTLQIPLMGGKDLQYLEDIVREHGEEKVLEIAGWLKNKDPSGNSMFKALRAIDTASRNWSNGKKSNGKVDIGAVLAEMMEDTDGN